MKRPNHVIINSKSHPVDFYFTIAESRWNGTWKTTSNIIIPPEARNEIKQLIKFLEKWSR